MGELQDVLSPSPSRAEESSNNSGKGGYTAAVQKIYGVLPPLTEEHHEAIDNLHTIIQVMQTHSYDLEGLAQANSFLTISNTALMMQLAHMNVTMNAMQEQLKKLASATTNQKMSKRKYYCCIFGSNYAHGSKNCSAKKSGNQEEACYNKRLGGSKKGRE